ncbi:hypothetical protein [Dactylosporangium sp. CA-092794]
MSLIKARGRLGREIAVEAVEVNTSGVPTSAVGISGRIGAAVMTRTLGP